MSVQRSNKRMLEFREKQAIALDMRRKGHLLREIGVALGIDKTSTVSILIQKAMREVVREPAEELVQMELDRLDTMFVKAYERAADHEKPLNREAVDTCLRIMERRAKLLGIDKPTKVASTDPSGEKSEPTVQFYIPSNGRD